ncbi:MAG TPA: purine-nucleoside phosphorylase [Candidatus Eisenbacteria bacterium]
MSPPLPAAEVARRVAEVLAVIRGRTALAPRYGLTLGSGLGGVIDRLEDPVVFEAASLPHWPRPTVEGHAGRLALGRWRAVPLVALAGRSHRYEGHPLDRVTFAVRVMAALGARALIFTNAVGALHAGYDKADLMLASDHINFIGKRGLLTDAELAGRGRARRSASAYAPRLREAIAGAAARAGVRLRRGILMGGLGPSYETAAEVRMGRALGADAACMSTVHEVTLAAELGCEAASLSCVTNRATGLADGPLSHDEVTEVADRGARAIERILEELFASA